MSSQSVGGAAVPGVRLQDRREVRRRRRQAVRKLGERPAADSVWRQALGVKLGDHESGMHVVAGVELIVVDQLPSSPYR